MSHFYGTLKGRRGGTSTRCGDKSGLTTTAASWSGAVSVMLHHDVENELDYYEVVQHPWHGHGVSHRIASGVIGEEAALVNGITKTEFDVARAAADALDDGEFKNLPLQLVVARLKTQRNVARSDAKNATSKALQEFGWKQDEEEQKARHRVNERTLERVLGEDSEGVLAHALRIVERLANGVEKYGIERGPSQNLQCVLLDPKDDAVALMKRLGLATDTAEDA